MNKENLQLMFNELKVNPLSYTLSGGLPNEKYVIDQGIGKWSVYYSEKGQKNNEKVFETEHEACQYMLKCVSEDLSTRINNSQKIRPQGSLITHRISSFSP